MSCTRPVAIVLAVLVLSHTAVLVVGAADSDPSDTVPDDGPAYGVNGSTFYRLWSNDVDDNNLSLGYFADADVSSRTEFERGLGKSTDVPFDSPPKAVETWNRGDLGDYNPGGRGSSVHPEDVTLLDGAYIKDGFVSFVAVQPSTILRQHGTQTQHISPDGEVLAISDYRVVVPDDDRRGGHREIWSLVSSKVDSISLRGGEGHLDSGNGHRATLTYTDLRGKLELTVEAEITAELKRVTRDCTYWNGSTDSCDGTWDRDVEFIDVSKTPSASQEVVVNRLTNISGKRVKFEEDTDLTGAVVHPDTRWSTIAVDRDVRVRSNWWFYTAGKSDWQTMVTESESGTKRSDSSVRPLQTYAYPVEDSPFVVMEEDNSSIPVQIEETWGSNQSGPPLPPNIDLEVADSFTNADSIALSSTSVDSKAFEEVTVSGIVRGQSETVTLTEKQTVRETNLALSVTETNSTHATVVANVTEAETGIALTDGNVTVGGQTSPVNGSGMATVTVENPPALIRGRYIPTNWWHTDNPHARTSVVAKPPADFPSFDVLAELAFVTLLWFLPLVAVAVGIDRLSSGQLFDQRTKL